MDGFTVVRCGSCAHMPSGFDDDGDGDGEDGPGPGVGGCGGDGDGGVGDCGVVGGDGVGGGVVAALPGIDEVLFEGLRAVVRDSPHGMLVTAGCRLGPAVCAGRRPGLMLLVQGCVPDRSRATSPVVVVG